MLTSLRNSDHAKSVPPTDWYDFGRKISDHKTLNGHRLLQFYVDEAYMSHVKQKKGRVDVFYFFLFLLFIFIFIFFLIWNLGSIIHKRRSLIPIVGT